MMRKHRFFQPSVVLPLGCSLALYAVLLSYQVYLTYFSPEQLHSSQPVLSLEFFFSQVISLSFLAVGLVVWLFARNRRVAAVLYACSIAMMITFVVEVGSIGNEIVSSILSGSSSLVTLGLFAIFVTLYPRDLLSRLLVKESRHHRPVGYRLLLWYLVAIALLLLPSMLGDIFFYTSHLFSDFLYYYVLTFYALFVLVGIIVTIILSYRGIPTLRERQQMRLLLGGVLLTFGPFLLLTVLPELLQLPPKFMVQAQISTLSVILLPLSLGYSVLRYQIRIDDRSIRPVVTLAVLAISLVVCTSFLLFVADALLSGVAVKVGLVCSIALLVPLLWRFARAASAWAFSPEQTYYHQLIHSTLPSILQLKNSEHLARLLVNLAGTELSASAACVYLLDEDAGSYWLAPTENREEERLSEILEGAFSPAPLRYGRKGLPDDILGGIKRPELLSTVIRAVDAKNISHLRSFVVRIADQADPLLVPIFSQGSLFGILALAGRSDSPYAGPDFEYLSLILDAFREPLNTSRQRDHAKRRQVALEALYYAILNAEGTTLMQVMQCYARTLEESLGVGVELWLLRHGELRRLLGRGPVSPWAELEPVSSGVVHLVNNAHFYDGRNEQPTFALPTQWPIQQKPVALLPLRGWVPLQGQVALVGMLVLTYGLPHRFSPEEKEVLALFSNEVAISIIKMQRLEDQQNELKRLQEVHRLRGQVMQLTTGQFQSFAQWVRQLVNQLVAYYDGEIAPDAIQRLLRFEQQELFLVQPQRGSDSYYTLFSAWRRNILTLVELFAPTLASASLSAPKYPPVARQPQGDVLIVTRVPVVRDLLVDLFMALQVYVPQVVRDEDEALGWIEGRQKAGQSLPVAILIHRVAALQLEAFESRLRQSTPPYARATSRIILLDDEYDPDAFGRHSAVDLLQTRLGVLHHLVDELC